MANLKERLLKNSTLNYIKSLTKSDIINNVENIPTKVYAINIALSGKLLGGIKRGTTLICGPSRHFKTNYSLIMAEAYLKQYPEAMCLFLDCEGGTPKDYFESVGIDSDRVIHGFFKNIEQLKHELVSQLEEIDPINDKLIIIIDSIGSAASLKEITDAEEGKSVGDMTRAKTLKSLWRIITPFLIEKNVPLIAINHVYQEIGPLYPKTIVGGGQGPLLSADNVWIVGRSQEKDGTELLGYNFIINIEKSRYVREKTKIPITVKFDGGISIYSGLIDIAMETGHVIKPSNGWYSRVIDGVVEDKKYRLKDTDNKRFWDDIINQKSFHEAIEKLFRISTEKLISDEEIEEEFDKVVKE